MHLATEPDFIERVASLYRGMKFTGPEVDFLRQEGVNAHDPYALARTWDQHAWTWSEANVREWAEKARVIHPAHATRFHRLHRTPDSVADLPAITARVEAALSGEPCEDLRARNRSGNALSEAVNWVERGFTENDVAQWLEAGAYDWMAAHLLRTHNVTPAEAAHVTQPSGQSHATRLSRRAASIHDITEQVQARRAQAAITPDWNAHVDLCSDFYTRLGDGPKTAESTLTNHP